LRGRSGLTRAVGAIHHKTHAPGFSQHPAHPARPASSLPARWPSWPWGCWWLAYWWLNPTPPNQVTLATGPAQSAYEEFGKRYQKALAADGIEVLLLPSEGSSANLQLLREGKADLAFVQGGTAELQPDDPDLLVSLGSLFVEPVWLFYRTDAGESD
jgi:TRAP-type uncharacterized transport system substrate-binding protein